MARGGLGDVAIIGMSGRFPRARTVDALWENLRNEVDGLSTFTEEELAALPPHMRRQEICEGRLTPFRLAVSIDDEQVFEDRIRPAGRSPPLVGRRGHPLEVELPAGRASAIALLRRWVGGPPRNGVALRSQAAA